MLVRLLTLLIVISLTGCATFSSDRQSQLEARQRGALSEAQRYFLEVAMHSEYGSSEFVLRRWERPVRYFIDGERPVSLERELELIVKELRLLAPRLNIQRAAKLDEANVIVFFGSSQEYAQTHAPESRKLLRKNWGLFSVKWFTDRRGIVQAKMYVDTSRAKRRFERRHLLREEFTQLLGLMADSQRYSDSIFYQSWSSVIRYSELDKKLIRMLYDYRLYSGMDERDVLKAWGY